MVLAAVLPGAGSNGSMIAHWASVSEEEGVEPAGRRR
jgi:hypothetical protein